MNTLSFDVGDKMEGCVLVPGQDSHMNMIEHEVQGRWTPPNDPAKGFKGTPPDGASEILLVQEWDDFQIRVRENLLEKVIETVETALTQLPQALTGEIASAILAFAQQLERLVRDEFRELIVHWSCSFTSPGHADVAILHAMDYRSTIHSTFSGTGGQQQRMTWTIDSRVFLNERPLANARISKNGQGSESETIERLDKGVTRGEDTIRSISKIRLDSDGFYKELEKLIESLMKIAEEAGKLSDTLDEYMREWVREQMDWYWDWFQAVMPNAAIKPSEEQQAAERARKKDELERRIRDAVRKIVDEFRSIFRDLITQWHGVIKMDVSRFRVTCLSEEGKLKLIEYLLEQGRNETNENTETSMELRNNIVLPGAAKAGFKTGEAVIPKPIWDSIGLKGEDYVVAIVPREEKPILETKIAKSYAKIKTEREENFRKKMLNYKSRSGLESELE